MENYWKTYRTLLLTCCLMLSACQKLINVAPPINLVVTSEVFTNDGTATSAVIGIYSQMMTSSSQFSSGYTTLFAGMSADELFKYTHSTTDEFTQNQLTVINHTNLTNYFWQPAYKYIYAANLAMEQINASNVITPTVKAQLLGELKFIRAFCYFTLINLFGDVPLITTSDYRVNASLARTEKSKVYDQIIKDLKDSQTLLLTSYPTTNRVRPNKWTATALLSKVYLYNRDWVNAETQASLIINSNIYSLQNNLNTVFVSSSNETIWQLMPVATSFNTYEGNAILPSTSSSTPTYLITNALLNAFESGDQRKAQWIGSRVFSGQTVFYPFKYKVFGAGVPVTEYYVVFRLAEQYLIRAESRAEQNNLPGAIGDLNLVRNRAGLANITASSQTNLSDVIFHERQVELFAEWGNRWFDLKRTNRANTVLGSLKPATWQPADVLWPIPQDQLNLNVNLTQNPGY